MGMVRATFQDDIWLVSLAPVVGSEIRKTRPCVIVSPDEMNRYLRTVIVAPMTTVTRTYASRVGLTFRGKRGQVALDQIRTVDRQRLVTKVGSLTPGAARAVADVLVEMFRRV